MKLDFLYYLLSLIVSVVFGYFFGRASSPAMYHLQIRLKRLIKIRKYHLHHDLGGLIIIAFSQFSPSIWARIMFTGIGIGLFIHHVITDGLKLITKSN
jgi:hypothetical protein